MVCIVLIFGHCKYFTIQKKLNHQTGGEDPKIEYKQNKLQKENINPTNFWA